MSIGSIKTLRINSGAISKYKLLSLEYLIVGGGSYGYYGTGNVIGGQGGAVVTGSKLVAPGIYAITVGAGGVGGTASSVFGVSAAGAAFKSTGSAIGGDANAGAIAASSINGADGVDSSISGTSYKYGAGGGGKSASSAGTGGLSGGGNASFTTTGTAGAANSGAGAGAGTPTLGGNGGSGIVIIRTLDTDPVLPCTGSPTITVAGGFRVYKFTGSGSITI